MLIFCLWSFLSSFFVFQQIATQIAVLIAKVARLDCPRQWPELIPILLESVKGQDGLQQHRALLTFYHVTKTLASKRLAQDRRLFQDVSLSKVYSFAGCFHIILWVQLIVLERDLLSCKCKLISAVAPFLQYMRVENDSDGRR